MAKNMISSVSYQLFNSFDELNAEDQQLIMLAQQACSTSYSPYSRFCVGAVLLLEDGTVVPGSNQENAAYPDGLCAERVALFAAGAQHPNKKISKIAVAARRADTELYLEASPCGSCRQVMLEYETKQEQAIEIIIRWGKEGYIKMNRLSDMLPFSFTKVNL